MTAVADNVEQSATLVDQWYLLKWLRLDIGEKIEMQSKYKKDRGPQILLPLSPLRPFRSSALGSTLLFVASFHRLYEVPLAAYKSRFDEFNASETRQGTRPRGHITRRDPDHFSPS